MPHKPPMLAAVGRSRSEAEAGGGSCTSDNWPAEETQSSNTPSAFVRLDIARSSQENGDFASYKTTAPFGLEALRMSSGSRTSKQHRQPDSMTVVYTRCGKRAPIQRSCGERKA